MRQTITSFFAVGIILACVLGCKKDQENDLDNEYKCIDGDGNLYKTVVIGNQEWMAENLRTTTYNDGTPIINKVNNSRWISDYSGAYCWYEHDSAAYADPCGALYNWYAVNTGKLCPKGWRVPSDKDWKTLEGYVDSNFGIGDPEWDKRGSRGLDAGERLKAINGWGGYGATGTDEFDLSMLPGGYRTDDNGNFGYYQNLGQWWTSCEEYWDGPYAWVRRIISNDNIIYRFTFSKRMGNSVRCVRDI